MPLAPAEAVGNVPDTQPVARHAGDGGRDAHPGHRPPDGVPIRHVAAVAVLRFHPLGKAAAVALAGGNRASRHLTPRSTATTAPVRWIVAKNSGENGRLRTPVRRAIITEAQL